jgi:hypothetical protein
MKTLSWWVMFGSILAPLAAGAASVTESDTISIDSETGPASEALSFAQFNSSLGTLTSVSIQATGQAQSVIALVNISGSAVTYSASSTTIPLQLSGNGLTPVSQTFANSSMGGGSVAANSTLYIPMSPAAMLGLSGSDPNLSAYIGSGSTTLDLGFLAGTSSETTSNGGSLFVGTDGIASGQLTVTYNYTPVPLPAALPLLLSGIAGLGAMIRRRKIALP